MLGTVFLSKSLEHALDLKTKTDLSLLKTVAVLKKKKKKERWWGGLGLL